MSVRRLDRVEPGLDSAHMLAREGERPLVDLCLGAGSLDVRDRERRAEVEVAVLDRERVAVERAHRRPGGPVAFRVVSAAMTWTAEAGNRQRRNQGHVL